MLRLLALPCLLLPALALEIKWESTATQPVVTHKDQVIFKLGEIAAFADGAWASQSNKKLSVATAIHDVSGTDKVLGAFKGRECGWEIGASKTPLITTVRNYADGLTVTMTTTWPKGAHGTSLVKANLTDDANQGVLANFPAIVDTGLPNTLSWQGSFVHAEQNVGYNVKGSQGGPTVFFDGGSDLDLVVVLSPLDNFKATSAGPGTIWDGSKAAFAPGVTGTITSLPVGFSQTFVLRAGALPGITQAIGEWGDLMQAVHGNLAKLPDVTLQKIGYQTDNGAGYVFCNPSEAGFDNCNELLIAELKALKALEVPMGYLSFQGAGASSMSHVKHSAPWCVNTWGPDLLPADRSPKFPMDMKPFQAALGVPLQLYAPYFCPDSKYFQRNDPNSTWVGVTSDNNLPGCTDYGFQDATPSESRAFYDAMFTRGMAVGMTSFEPDFMNQNYNCVPDFIESATNSDQWQHGMTDAALAKNITVQWCYAAPTDVLNSLTMPALTNFRVSNDFCYGKSWDIGASSLIVWAVGAAPSKDTLWTSANGGLNVPGCPWTPDHEEPAAELHVVLSLMSTGPVGISDLINHTNVPLIKRTISADGTLLKPSKPITAVDSSLANPTASAPGHVFSTYSQGASKAVALAWYFVSFKMTASWALPASDFYPRAHTPVVYRAFDGGAGCKAKAAASTCVTEGGAAGQVLMIPKSNLANVTGGTDYAPAVVTVWPRTCTSGFVLLGELSKYVALSPERFQNTACTADGLTTTVVGSPGEVVMVTLLAPATGSAVNTLADGKVVVEKVTIGSNGQYLLVAK